VFKVQIGEVSKKETNITVLDIVSHEELEETDVNCNKNTIAWGRGTFTRPV
jgi:hypothetical protein